VYGPTQILIISSASNPPSKLFSILGENLEALQSKVTLLDRRYWAETTGLEYIQQLAFREDIEAIKLAVTGNFFAVCCFAAVSNISVRIFVLSYILRSSGISS